MEKTVVCLAGWVDVGGEGRAVQLSVRRTPPTGLYCTYQDLSVEIRLSTGQVRSRLSRSGEHHTTHRDKISSSPV